MYIMEKKEDIKQSKGGEQKMGLQRVQINKCVCERCAYSWIPKDEEELPVTCPNCRSPYWNKPRKQAAVE